MQGGKWGTNGGWGLNPQPQGNLPNSIQLTNYNNSNLSAINTPNRRNSNHKRWKYKDIFELGELIEDIFNYSCRVGCSQTLHRIYKVKNWDIRERIDYVLEMWVGGMDAQPQQLQRYYIDVKGRRLLKRKFEGTPNFTIAIELYNSAGHYVPNKQFTHFAFELPNYSGFMVIHKEVVYRLIDYLISHFGGDVVHTPQYFSFYARKNDGKSLVYLIPEDYFYNVVEQMNLYDFKLGIPPTAKSRYLVERIRMLRKKIYGFPF